MSCTFNKSPTSSVAAAFSHSCFSKPGGRPTQCPFNEENSLRARVRGRVCAHIGLVHVLLGPLETYRQVMMCSRWRRWMFSTVNLQSQGAEGREGDQPQPPPPPPPPAERLSTPHSPAGGLIKATNPFLVRFFSARGSRSHVRPSAPSVTLTAACDSDAGTAACARRTVQHRATLLRAPEEIAQGWR